jgi:hypothetical protein
MKSARSWIAEEPETLHPSPDDGVRRHFTICDRHCDVPALLERVRIAIIGRGPINVYALSFTEHHDGPERVLEMTVYYLPCDARQDSDQTPEQPI